MESQQLANPFRRQHERSLSRSEERQEKTMIPSHRTRRWEVEACHSQINRFRKILARFEKTDTVYLGLGHLVRTIIARRKVSIINP